MGRSTIALVRAATATLPLLLAVPPGAFAQSPEEIACRASIGKNVGKYTTRVMKTIAKCHRKRSAGKLSSAVDCNAVGEADPDDRLASHRAKLADAIADACGSQPSVLALYARCPSPAHTTDDGGATDGIDDVAELGSCMAGLVDGLAGKAALEALGRPARQISKTLAKCQTIVGKSTAKLFKTYFKVRVRCQKGLDGQGEGLTYGCDGYDAKQRIAKARSKLSLLLGKTCNLPDPEPRSAGNETIDTLNACGDTRGQLEECIGDVLAERLASGMVAMAYGLPATCQAGGLIRRVFAGYGSRITETQLGAGSNGIAHSIDFADGFADPIVLSCDADCADCELSLDTDATRTVPVCRCSNDPKIACSTIGGTDPACTGLGATCQCHFGPPLATTAAGNPACVDIRVTDDYDGTVNLGSGASDNPLTVSAVIHLGLFTDVPCPLCEGDITANDGVRDGACSDGQQNGQACDSNGTNPNYGPVSVDCQPSTLTNISGAGLPLNFRLFSDDQELPHTLPCDTPAGELCPCRTCSGDTSIGCRSDDECPDGTGPCTGGGGAGISKNGCSDFVCNADSRCATGPVDTFCSSPTKPNGEGLATCSSDLDCSEPGATCSLQETRRCYPDPIRVDGSPGLFRSDIGGLACIGVTSNAVINLASGLPGPVRVALHHSTDVTCGSDPNVIWNPPAGANCTPTTSTTTTTLIPPVPCETLLPPVCGVGDCPAGEVCVDSGLACACEVGTATTTTTLPTLACSSLLVPGCALGTCPIGQTCAADGLACACQSPTTTTTLPDQACRDSAPVCNGPCPAGQTCQLFGIECLCF